MKTLIVLLAQALTLALALALAAPGAPAQTLVLENVRLVDVDQATVSAPARIVVDDGFVHAEPAAAAQIKRIDGAGGYLIPGLAEMHAHIPPMSSAARVDDVLILYLAHGITTIRGMLGEPGHLQLRAELAGGQRHGPRLVTSGPSFNGNSVSSASQAAAMALQQAEAGYDFMKLHPGLWPESFAAIAATGQALGLPYAGHVADAVGLERALAAGQATIDHLDGYAQVLVPEGHPARQQEAGFFGFNIAAAMDPGRVDEWARRTAEAGVWNVPTQALIENLALGNVEALLARPAMQYIDQSERRRWADRVRQMQSGTKRATLQHFVQVRRRLILALHKAGAGLLLGSDAPQIMNVPGDSVHHELEILVAAGLSPAAALAAGTTAVAKFLRQPAYGCLQPGCVADMVLLEASPFESISNTRRITGVMRAGKWYDRAALDAMLKVVAARAGKDA